MHTVPLSPEWRVAFQQLVALRPSAPAHLADANVLSACRCRAAGHALFNARIQPMIAAGKQLAVVVGFVSPLISSEPDLGFDGLTPEDAAKFGTFSRVRLVDLDTGEVHDIEHE